MSDEERKENESMEDDKNIVNTSGEKDGMNIESTDPSSEEEKKILGIVKKMLKENPSSVSPQIEMDVKKQLALNAMAVKTDDRSNRPEGLNTVNKLITKASSEHDEKKKHVSDKISDERREYEEFKKFREFNRQQESGDFMGYPSPYYLNNNNYNKYYNSKIHPSNNNPHQPPPPIYVDNNFLDYNRHQNILNNSYFPNNNNTPLHPPSVMYGYSGAPLQYPLRFENSVDTVQTVPKKKTGSKKNEFATKRIFEVISRVLNNDNDNECEDDQGEIFPKKQQKSNSELDKKKVFSNSKNTEKSSVISSTEVREVDEALITLANVSPTFDPLVLMARNQTGYSTDGIVFTENQLQNYMLDVKRNYLNSTDKKMSGNSLHDLHVHASANSMNNFINRNKEEIKQKLNDYKDHFVF